MYILYDYMSTWTLYIFRLQMGSGFRDSDLGFRVVECRGLSLGLPLGGGFGHTHTHTHLPARTSDR